MAEHTPGPWRSDGNPYNIVGSAKNVARMYGRFEDDEADANTRLIKAACNSYDKHCGPNAVECAEGDLLGEALEVCRALASYDDSGGLGTFRGIPYAARAVLAKAAPAPEPVAAKAKGGVS